MIAGFCRDSLGSAFIQQGNYRILKSESDQIIHPLQIGAVLRAGMTVEMSIVLREQAEARSKIEEHRCPRCRHINSKVITASGWVDWYDDQSFVGLGFI